MRNINLENIKWASIQPLTGGMYLGTEEAIGHPAEFILSFTGLDNITYKKSGEPGNVSNEHYLKTYLTKHGRMPDYYQIEGGLFDMLGQEHNLVIKKDGVDSTPDYSGLDLVVAVPICAGLSKASTGSAEDRDKKNNNMKFISKYTLEVIKPKVYVFENAPGLMSPYGESVREYLEQLAMENHYSILYYKTDTNLHSNCQRRPRTFVIFFKHRSDNLLEDPMLFDYEHKKIDLLEYFQNINSPYNNVSPETPSFNWVVLDFIKKEYGSDWRDKITGSLMAAILRDKKLDDLVEYAKEHNCSQKGLEYFAHIKKKKDMGMNYFHNDLRLPKGFFAPVQGRCINYMLHPVEDRICTIREYLALMGMPDDFEFYGDIKLNSNKIGQNVPVKTAKFIVEQCLNCLDKWETEPVMNFKNSAFQDNTTCTEVW